MKNWKKWLAALLAVVMTMSLLAACGDSGAAKETEEETEKTTEKQEESKPEESKPEESTPAGDAAPEATQPSATQPSQDTAAPTEPAPTEPQPTEPEQNVPTVAADFYDAAVTLEELNAYNEMTLYFDGEDGVVTIAIKNVNENKSIVYCKDYYSDGSSYEVVIELENDVFTGYTRNDAEPFAQYGDQEELQADATYIAEQFLMVSLDGGAYGELGETYVLAGEKASTTGLMSVYNEYLGEDLWAEIYVDQATGVIMKYEYTGEDGFSLWEVVGVSTSVELPAYK